MTAPPAGERLADGDGEDAHDLLVGERRQRLERGGGGVLPGMAAGHEGLVLATAEPLQHGPAFGRERRLRRAAGEARGDSLVRRLLAFALHLPMAGRRDDMRQQQPQRDARMAGQGRPHGGMPVQVEIAPERPADLRPRRRFPLLRVLLRPQAAGFLAGEPAFVQLDLALVRDGDEDLAALRLRHALMLPFARSGGPSPAPRRRPSPGRGGHRAGRRSPRSGAARRPPARRSSAPPGTGRRRSGRGSRRAGTAPPRPGSPARRTASAWPGARSASTASDRRTSASHSRCLPFGAMVRWRMVSASISCRR